MKLTATLVVFATLIILIQPLSAQSSQIARDSCTYNAVNSFKPMSSSITSIFFSDRNNGLAVGNNHLALKTSDGGNTWTKLVIDSVGDFVSVVSLSSDVSFVVGQYVEPIDNAPHPPVAHYNYHGYLYKTTDGGKTWTTLFHRSDQHSDERFYDCHFFDADNGFVVGMEIFKTSDGGKTWSNIPALYPYYSKIQFVNRNIGFIAGASYPTVFKTINGGASWDVSIRPSTYFS
jgi:photosystem II stability/assembly factor-like uncharacterized protein